MTQTPANKSQKKAPAKEMKNPRPASIKTKRSPIKLPTTAAPEIDESRFADLWVRFEDEAGFTSDRMEQDRQRILEEVAALQAKVDERRSALQALDGRLEAAKQQMRMLLGARLSDDSILSAMRVEYKVRKINAKSKTGTDPLPEADDSEKQFVLDNLDAEGLSIAELKKVTGRDGRVLRSVLESLIKEGKIVKSGERASAKFHLV